MEETPVSRWGTIFLLVLAVSVAAALVFFEPGFQSLRPALVNRTQLITIDPLALKSLRITSGSEFIELTRQPDGWSVGPDPEDRADAARVGELLMTISDLEIFDTIPGTEIRSKKDLRPFGLDSPRNQWEIVDSKSVKVLLGKEAVGEGRIYAQVEGDPNVYVVSNPMDDATYLTIQALRDRRLTRYDAANIDQLIIRRPNGELEIQRTPKGWDLVRPLRAPADPKRVDALLNALLGSGIQSFPTELNHMTPGPNQSGSVEVVIFPDHSDASEHLWIRGESDANGLPVTVVHYPSRRATFLLDADYLRLTEITPGQIRSRTLMPLNLDTVDAIRVEKNGAPLAVWRRESDHWTHEQSQASAPAAQVAATVSNLLNESVTEYQPATQDALQLANIHDHGLTIYFDAIASENTPEVRAGRHPVSQLKIGTMDANDARVQVNSDPEIARIPSASVQKFLRWAAPADTEPPAVESAP